MLTPHEIKRGREIILKDLKKNKSRTYDRVSDRLRHMIENHVPEAEIVAVGDKERIQMRNGDVSS